MKTNDKTLAAILEDSKIYYGNGATSDRFFDGLIDLKNFIKEWRELNSREKLEAYLYLTQDNEPWDNAIELAKTQSRIIGEPGDTIEELCQEVFYEDFETTIEKTGNSMLEFAVTCCLDWTHLANEWMLEAPIREGTDPETGWPVYYYEY